MSRKARIALLCMALLMVASPALAQGPAGGATGSTTPLISFGSAFAAGLVILGAAYGISRIGSHAVDSMARQPEVAGSIQTAMIISAALIEGATFFALIVCLART